MDRVDPFDLNFRDGLMGWFSVAVTRNRVDRVHVLPVDDLRVHDIDMAGQCWCKPSFDDEDNIFTHHALDGREAFERGERLVS